MQKKVLPIVLVMTFMLGLSFQMIPQAFAAHKANVKWIESGSNFLAVSPISWPRWLNFTVYNEGPNAITEIKFVIQKDNAGNALFKFENSEHKQAAKNWRAIPDEFGPDNYPTVIYFRADPSGQPLAPGATGEFDIFFSNGPATCKYKFDLWTSDDGSPSGIDHNVLEIIMDGKPPVIDVKAPLDGKTVEAIFAPYPSSWYLWINFTVTDNPDHNSNISRFVVDILEVDKKPEWDISYKPPYPSKVTFNEKYWNLPEGNYTLVLTAFDGAGNKATVTIKFKFVIPWLVRLTPTKGTVGPTTTFDPKKGVYIGSKYEYGNKVLGTEVKIETRKGAFTPNSKVNVTVYGLPYTESALVLKNLETDSEGKLKGTPSFLFPTAPHGVYDVIIVDAKGISVPLKFTVIPEIIYKPAVVIGPAMIEVIATGLPAGARVNGLTCNGTDALLGVNGHVMYRWYTDANGTLQTPWADKPGFLMPVIEPGKYEIGLRFSFFIIEGFEECHEDSISNFVSVVNDFKELMEIFEDLELKLDQIKPVITRIDNNVATIKTDVGTIKAKVEDIQPKVTDIKDRVVNIQTLVGDVKGIVESVKGDVVYIKTNEGWDVRLKLSDILNKIPPPAPDVSMGVNIATVLSAVAAIAAIVAAAVVVKRLKVAA